MNKYLLKCALLCLLTGLLFILSKDSTSPASFEDTTLTVVIPNSVETIINDMKLAHEGIPKGVPTSYSWALHPRLNMGIDPGTFRAMTAWGQLYEDSDGNPATNTRVQIRDMKAYVLSKNDNQWHLLQSSRLVEGDAYQADFIDDINKPADIRYENDGSLSVTAGNGYNFHFWPATGRVVIDPSDIGGIFTTVQARLVLNDSNLPDDRSQARYLLDVGGDYWLSLTAKWDQLRTNDDIGIGRFKFVTTEWQSFNMTTLTESEIRQNPPPLE